MNDHERHLEMHRRFLEGQQWHFWRRLRWWWKPWTWLRSPGEWIDPRPAFERHVYQHRNLLENVPRGTSEEA